MRMVDFLEFLKEGIKEVYDWVENIQFVKDFLKGNIKKELFKLVIMVFYFIYLVFEEEMECNKDYLVFVFLYFFMELYWKEVLIKDMEYFFGENWEEQVQCFKVVQKYVEWIYYIGQNELELLVVYVYICYMGDFLGGQVLKKVVQ